MTPAAMPEARPIIIRRTDAPQNTQKDPVPIREKSVLKVTMGEGSKTSFPAISDKICHTASQNRATAINFNSFFVMRIFCQSAV